MHNFGGMPFLREAFDKDFVTVRIARHIRAMFFGCAGLLRLIRGHSWSVATVVAHGFN